VNPTNPEPATNWGAFIGAAVCTVLGLPIVVLGQTIPNRIAGLIMLWFALSAGVQAPRFKDWNVRHRKLEAWLLFGPIAALLAFIVVGGLVHAY
jgi:hypothetical protein